MKPEELLLTEDEIVRVGTDLQAFSLLACTLDEDDLRNPVKPFPQFEYLKRLLGELEKIQDVHIEKSRQMSVSWACCLAMLWHAMFTPGFSGFITTQRETDADDGGSRSTPLSLMGKIRFLHDNLPPQIKTLFPIEFKQGFALADATCSMIKAGSSNPNAGRGGTYSIALIDEAAYVKDGELVFKSLRSACKKGLWLVSTPDGKGNNFARIRFNENSGFKKLRIHWSEHPHRDQAWFDEYTRDMTAQQIASELEISYEGSKEGVIYGPFFNASTQVREDIDWEPDRKNVTGWDLGFRDATAIIFGQVNNLGELYILDCYENTQKTVNHYGPVYDQITEAARQTILSKMPESERKNAEIQWRNIGDSAGTATNSHGFSWFSGLADQGIKMIGSSKKIKVVDGINAVSLLLQKNQIFIHPRCARLLDCLWNYAWKKTETEVPEHDEFSHMMDALRYLVVMSGELSSFTRPRGKGGYR